MKVTSQLIKEFEMDKKQFGTSVALHNLLWQAAAQQLRELGAKRIITT